MARILAALILFYAASSRADETQAIVICTCGEPAFIIHQTETSWSIFCYDRSEFENQYNLILRWMCRQKLKSINNFQILKTEDYIGQKCPIQVKHENYPTDDGVVL